MLCAASAIRERRFSIQDGYRDAPRVGLRAPHGSADGAEDSPDGRSRGGVVAGISEQRYRRLLGRGFLIPQSPDVASHPRLMSAKKTTTRNCSARRNRFQIRAREKTLEKPTIVEMQSVHGENIVLFFFFM